MRTLQPLQRHLHASSAAPLRPLPGALGVPGDRLPSDPLGPLADESADQHQARAETCLMARFRDARGEAEFEALYRSSEPTIRRFVLMALGSRSGRFDAQELVQDVFVNIYRYATRFRDEHPFSFRAWAQMVCRNVVRRAMTPRRDPSFSDLSEALAEPEDARAGPLQLADEDEQWLDLSRAWLLLVLHYARAYDQLAPRDRLALHLVEVAGQSYAEVGDHLGVGPSNMKMIMFRARRRIRAHMARAMGLEEAEEPPQRRAAG